MIAAACSSPIFLERALARCSMGTHELAQLGLAP
jgi:hypothetical protein